MKGKTCLELGSGMGLGGIAAAMLGCHTTLSDVADVVPLLRANAVSNFDNDKWSSVHRNLVPGLSSSYLAVPQLNWQSGYLCAH